MSTPEFSRPLEISDLATLQEKEIRKNPWRFLNLTEGASLTDARRAFIGVTKIYHPDLFNPRTDPANLKKSYSQDDLIRAGLSKNIINTIREASQTPTNESFMVADQRRQYLEKIRALAHERMVLINRAYEEIKRRANPADRKSIAGYDPRQRYSTQEQSYVDEIGIEGHGKVTIYTASSDYWVAGPYLSFDWGQPIGHEWDIYDDEWRHVLNLKHLFAHVALQKGHKPSQVLLQPFADCFHLDEVRLIRLMDLLKEENRADEIYAALKVDEIPAIPTEAYVRKLRMIRQLNEIICLDPVLSEEYARVQMQMTEDGTLILKDRTESIFPEPDVMLFATLAYGPLLK